MKADYYRHSSTAKSSLFDRKPRLTRTEEQLVNQGYIAEFRDGDAKSSAAEKARQAYQEAEDTLGQKGSYVPIAKPYVSVPVPTRTLRRRI